MSTAINVIFSIFTESRYIVGELKRQTVSLLQFRSFASRAVNYQIYFGARMLHCPCDVPLCLMFLYILK